jgi:hypothetical protein
MEVSGNLYSPTALTPEKFPSVPFGLGVIKWAPQLVWTLWSTQKSLALAGNRTLIPWHIAFSAPYFQYFMAITERTLHKCCVLMRLQVS